MAGGIGSRLYPLSTPERPKQFLDLLDTGKTLIQMTVDRFLGLAPITNFWVVTSASYVHFVKEQIPDIPADHILAEPCARNTAPCIAYACRKIAKKHPDACVVVTPADALVTETVKFRAVIAKAIAFADLNEAIVTVGISPTRPDTEYGYIKATRKYQNRVVPVAAFKEKPDKATAESYLADGHYFWNAGIFVFAIPTMLRELKAYAPQITGQIDRLEPYLYTPKEQEMLGKLFPLCDKISIDYAVMERSTLIHTIASHLGWSDLGSFAAIATAKSSLK